MIRPLTILLALTLVACAGKKPPPAPPQAEAPKITLEIEITPASVRATENMELRIRIQNISNQAIAIADSEPIRDFHIEIRTAEGKSVDLTPMARQILTGPNWRYVMATLMPAQTSQTIIPLRSYFLLDQPGQYRITVSRDFSIRPGTPAAHVQSNTVDLQINEAN